MPQNKNKRLYIMKAVRALTAALTAALLFLYMPIPPGSAIEIINGGEKEKQAPTFSPCGTSYPASQAGTTAFEWYCGRREAGVQPPIAPEMSFAQKYNCYYLDRYVPAGDKVIYLTFDAGYENGNVAKILDVLKKHNAVGAFFILDNIIKTDTALVERMANEGHLVCNHTTKHRDMSKVTEKTEFAKELASLEDVYRQYTGREMAKFYRPPCGRFTELNLKHATELGYTTMFWSFAYADWDNNAQPSPETSRKKILEHTHNGEILLLHPTSSTNAAILDSLMNEWEAQGYRFGSLGELDAHRNEIGKAAPETVMPGGEDER